MSGRKRARASLSREHRARLRQELRQSKQLGDALAEAANVAQQARTVVSELGADVGRYLPGDLALFEALLPAFEGEHRALEAVLADLAAISRRAPIGAAVAQASTLRAQAETRLAKLDEKVVELRSAADRITRRLDSQRNEALRKRLQQVRVRRSLEGVRAELEHRLRPASAGSLNRIAPKAKLMLRQLDAVLGRHGEGAAPIGADAVGNFKKRLEKLVEDAARLDQLEAERRAMLKLLDQSIRATGFEPLLQEQLDGSGGTVELRYVRRQAVQRSQIRVSIPLEGEIILEMLGPKGPRSFLLGPDTACDSNVRRIIEEGRKREIDIRVFGIGRRGPSVGSVALERERADPLRAQAELEHQEGRA